MPSPIARHEIPGDARLAKRMDRDLLPPMQAIHAATGGAALILGADKELGTIEVGKWADLVFLDADPVADIRNTRRIWNVMHNGQLIDRSAILKTIKPASV
jgi:imidazolonepropionase-like amidohydrolase